MALFSLFFFAFLTPFPLGGPATTTPRGRPGFGGVTVTTTGTLPMTITETGFLPTGITFVDNGDGTATLSGTVASSATLEGDWPITITASNGTPPDASQPFTIHVTCVAITSANHATFIEGENGSFPVTGTTACHGTIVWASVSPGAPPAGVFLTDNLNGTATLSGTPGPGTAGVWHFTIYGVDGDPPSNRQSFTLTVGPPLVVTSHSFNATEGTLTTGQVASFSGGNGPFSATIAWGDGTSSAGTISGSNVFGSHTFAEEGPTNITVSVTDAGTTASSTIAQTIGDAALFSTDLGSVPIGANEGAVFSGQVMSFDDTDPGKTAGDYTASIAWGDGTISAGTVVAVGAGFGVTGSHAYAEHGTYNGITTVTDHASTASSSLTATIAEVSPLVVSGTNFTATAGVSFSGQVGTVADNGNKEAISDYVVTIDWGDGTHGHHRHSDRSARRSPGRWDTYLRHGRDLYRHHQRARIGRGPLRNRHWDCHRRRGTPHKPRAQPVAAGRPVGGNRGPAVSGRWSVRRKAEAGQLVDHERGRAQASAQRSGQLDDEPFSLRVDVDAGLEGQHRRRRLD